MTHEADRPQYLIFSLPLFLCFVGLRGCRFRGLSVSEAFISVGLEGCRSTGMTPVVGEGLGFPPLCLSVSTLLNALCENPKNIYHFGLIKGKKVIPNNFFVFELNLCHPKIEPNKIILIYKWPSALIFTPYNVYLDLLISVIEKNKTLLSAPSPVSTFISLSLSLSLFLSFVLQRCQLELIWGLENHLEWAICTSTKKPKLWPENNLPVPENRASLPLRILLAS